METCAEQQRRRFALAARTPGLDADALDSVARVSADLELLERPEPAALAALGLTTTAIESLAAPDAGRHRRRPALAGDIRLPAAGLHAR